MGSATPEKVVLGGLRKQGEQTMRISQLSSMALLQECLWAPTLTSFRDELCHGGVSQINAFCWAS